MLPYERLLGEAMEGDPALFAREDSVDAAWAVVQPILGRRDAGARIPAGKLGSGRRRSLDRRGGRLARDDRMTAPAVDPGVRAAAALAADLVEDGAKVGLGTGPRGVGVHRAARRAGARRGCSVDLRRDVRGCGAAGARASGLPLIELTEDVQLDVTVDGADEVAPNLDLLKGRGGAFVRERIVAAASRRQVILVGPEKLVGALAETGPIPVEIIPMALGLCLRRFKQLGARPDAAPGSRWRRALRQRQRQPDRRRRAAGAAGRRRRRRAPSMPRSDRSRASSTPDCSSQPRNT